jgi:transcriptional regulator with PAS, ATPase and Fis domain
MYYRLNVVRISLPPLTERREDVPLLVENFISQFNLSKGKEIAGVTDEVMEFLMNYDYPGNVRELQNIIEHAFVLCKGRLIQLNHIPREVLSARLLPEREGRRPHRNPLEEAEAALIRQALERHGGSRMRAAQELGYGRVTLWRKMKRLKLQV